MTMIPASQPASAAACIKEAREAGWTKVAEHLEQVSGVTVQEGEWTPSLHPRDRVGRWAPVGRDTFGKTKVDDSLKERLAANGVMRTHGLENVPSYVTGEAIRALEDVRAQIEPTAKKPDAIGLRSLEAKGDDRWWTMQTEPVRDGAVIAMNTRQTMDLVSETSQGSVVGFTSWATRDPYGRMLHELGHAYQMNLTNMDTTTIEVALHDAGMKGLYEAPKDQRRQPGWPSMYAQSNPTEGFAEMFALIMRPESLDRYYKVAPADGPLVRENLIKFRDSWNRQMRERGLPTLPENTL